LSALSERVVHLLLLIGLVWYRLDSAVDVQYSLQCSSPLPTPPLSGQPCLRSQRDNFHHLFSLNFSRHKGSAVNVQYLLTLHNASSPANNAYHSRDWLAAPGHASSLGVTKALRASLRTRFRRGTSRLHLPIFLSTQWRRNATHISPPSPCKRQSWAQPTWATVVVAVWVVSSPRSHTKYLACPSSCNGTPVRTLLRAVRLWGGFQWS